MKEQQFIFLISVFAVAFMLCGAVSATGNITEKKTYGQNVINSHSNVGAVKIDSGSKNFYDPQSKGMVRFSFKTYKYSSNYIILYGSYFYYKFGLNIPISMAFQKISYNTLKITTKSGSKSSSSNTKTNNSALFIYCAIRNSIIHDLTDI